MSEANKAVVARLVNEVLSSGRLDVIDELFSPDLADGARRWIARSGNLSLGTWQGHPATGRRFENVPACRSAATGVAAVHAQVVAAVHPRHLLSGASSPSMRGTAGQRLTRPRSTSCWGCR